MSDLVFVREGEPCPECVRERTGWCFIHGRYWPQWRQQCWLDPDPLWVEPEEEAPRSGAAVVAALAAIVAFAAGLVVGHALA